MRDQKKGSILIYGIIVALVCFLLIGIGVGYKMFIAPTFSNSWNGIKPGVTTKSEVIGKMGLPISEIDLPFNKGLLYNSGIKVFPNVIIYDEKTGRVEGELVMITNANDSKKYYQEMTSLGKPEKIMHSNYLSSSKLFIFPQKGVTYSANEVTKMVDGIHYYSPTNIDSYLARYGKFFAVENKFEL